MKKKLLISFSGGRTSAYMTYFLLHTWKDRHLYDIIVVFANTGKEKEATLQFIKKCDDTFGFNTVWIEAIHNPLNKYGVTAKVVDFKTADREGKVFEDTIKKHGIPNRTSPHCSRQMKEEAIRAYGRSIGWKGKDYQTAIGIRFDENSRINWTKAKRKHLLYPLTTIKKTVKNDINTWWSNQSFDLEIKSYEGNCDFCWKKSNRKLMTIIKEDPKVGKWWEEMQEKYGNFIPESRKDNKNIKLPIRFFRENQTVNDFVEESKFPFQLARDESKDVAQYRPLTWEEYFDSNDGCSESCEAF